MMDRKTLRDIKNLPLRDFERVFNQVFDQEMEKVRSHCRYQDWTSMMLALADRFPEIMSADMLHSIGMDTLDYINCPAPASELAAQLKERTGFDVYERPSESKLDYIPKE